MAQDNPDSNSLDTESQVEKAALKDEASPKEIPEAKSPTAEAKSSIMERLDRQMEWYDKRSMSSQGWYKKLKVIEIVSAALIPFIASNAGSALIPEPLMVVGGLGVIIVILESLQSIYQFQSNWLVYRSTYEELRRELALFEARADVYGCAEDPERLLAERAENILSSEQAKWSSAQEGAGRIRKPLAPGQK